MEFTRVVRIGGNEYAVKPDGSKRRIATFYGTSNRVRPKYADGARDADKLMETDTGFIGVFDEEINDWRPIARSS